MGILSAATELHHIVSSNPGAQKMKVKADRLGANVLRTHLCVRRNEYKSTRMGIVLLIAEPNVSRSDMDQHYFILDKVPMLR